MKIKFWILVVSIALSTNALCQGSIFPNSPIKIIVPFPPGAGADISARYFGRQLGLVLGQPIIVENRPGALGAIAVNAVKSAPADGCTIFLGSNSPMTVNPVMVKNLSYDPLKDLKPISGLARNTNVVIVAGNSPLRTLAELIATTKSSKQTVSMGVAAAGYQIVLEWFASVASVKFNVIPYKGGTPVYNDVAGGILNGAIAELAGTSQLIKAGKLRALATFGEFRHPDFPDVPTVKESGYPSLVSYSWNAFYVRSETPDEVTAKLAEAMKKVLATDGAKKFVAQSGTELMPLGPAAMRSFQEDEYRRFLNIADIAGIKAQ
jgi:tripartite-type tricarboxylate transporter receptor subunit TctC